MISEMVPLEVIELNVQGQGGSGGGQYVGVVTYYGYGQALGCMELVLGCRVCSRQWEGLGRNYLGIVGF